MSTPIGVVHATRVAVSPIEAAFESHWPSAEVVQLIDESLARDLDAIGHLTPELSGRIGRLSPNSQSEEARRRFSFHARPSAR